MIAQLKTVARLLKRDVLALSLAARDPRTPVLAKFIALLVVAYALSPIDLIPDFIPVLGHLDDVILVPLGLWVAVRLIPPPVMEDARTRAAHVTRTGRSALGAVLVLLAWIALILLVWWAWPDRSPSSPESSPEPTT